MTQILNTNERGVTVRGAFKIWSDAEDRDITVSSKLVPWDTLRAAAKQEDRELAKTYADILSRAEGLEAKRIISEDWKQFGYPLRTGFGRQYQGQHVMRAWEVRRLQRDGKDMRVAYIVTWDRSDNTRTRKASPAFVEYDQAIAWLAENYGGWHDELGGERTADTWLYA